MSICGLDKITQTVTILDNIVSKRYAFYWLPHIDTHFGILGKEWFVQKDFFYDFIKQNFPECETLNFAPNIHSLKKYGFHTEFYPPFSVVSPYSEKDVFNILSSVVKQHSGFNIKLHLSESAGQIFLHSTYTISSFANIIDTLHTDMAGVNISFPVLQDTHISEFKIILSQTTNQELHNALYKIAQKYWEKILTNPVHCDSISLCYQNTQTHNFKELTRLPLKLIY